MDERTRQAIARDWLVDITTTGRKSGKQHTVEVLLRQIDGQLYLSNQPMPSETGRQTCWSIRSSRTTSSRA